MIQKTKQSKELEIRQEYYSRLDAEYLFTVISGDNSYRVCLRESGGNRCTCPYGYIARNSPGKRCKHEKVCLEKVRE